MKIVFTLHTDLDSNAGAPGLTVRLAEACRELGHEVDIISYDDLPTVFRNRFAHVRPTVFAIFMASRLFRLRSVDVIDASTGDGWLLFALLGRRRRRPLLVTRSHGLEHTLAKLIKQMPDAVRHAAETRPRARAYLYSFGLRLKEIEWSIRQSDMVLLSNRSDQSFARTRFGVPPTYRIFRNGVDKAMLAGPAPAYVPQGEPLCIAQIGSFIERKGIHYSVPALRTFLDLHPGARALFLGTGVPDAVIFGAFPKELRDRIDVRRHYDNAQLPELLSGAHILLLPSLFEGAPVCLIEGMARGLAPVATAIPGPTEIVTSGRNGLLVPPRSVEALLSAFESLDENRALLDKLRKQAHSDVQTYSWTEIAPEQLELYGSAR